jgi:hypothetical protein
MRKRYVLALQGPAADVRRAHALGKPALTAGGVHDGMPVPPVPVDLADRLRLLRGPEPAG